jgi:NADH:ubiquinone oxidoreductase subunit E
VLYQPKEDNMSTVKGRIKDLITMLDQVQNEGRQLTETEKMEFTAELLSIAEQKAQVLKEMEE